MPTPVCGCVCVVPVCPGLWRTPQRCRWLVHLWGWSTAAPDKRSASPTEWPRTPTHRWLWWTFPESTRTTQINTSSTCKHVGKWAALCIFFQWANKHVSAMPGCVHHFLMSPRNSFCCCLCYWQRFCIGCVFSLGSIFLNAVHVLSLVSENAFFIFLCAVYLLVFVVALCWALRATVVNH